MIVVDEPQSPDNDSRRRRDRLEIALVNNMPDAALRQTERQFASLLAATAVPIRLRRYTIPRPGRSSEAKELFRRHYRPASALPEARPDAVIITGCEPLSADLSAEPYWHELAALLRWAQRNTVSTIASCLAAHARVLAFDGIVRQPLAEKCSGLFGQRVICNHPLCAGMPETVEMPHSRMNDISSAALVACGYRPLIESDEIGWTLAVKDDTDHLCVLMQGHPEYGPQTLLAEYRRDVRRFLGGERPDYPQLPDNCAPPLLAQALHAFADEATAGWPLPELMASFPPIDALRLRAPWRQPAEILYTNWVNMVRHRCRMRNAAYA
jgi:homoserine O-succinyltransferase